MLGPGLAVAQGLGNSGALLGRRTRLMDFSVVAKHTDDYLAIPNGYTAQVLYRLGDPISHAVAEYLNDGSESAASFEYRAGDHHDGMHYFGLNHRGTGPNPGNAKRGLLVMNHENITQSFLHSASEVAAGFSTSSRVPAQIDKEVNVHGISVIEVVRDRDGFEIDKGSRYNRRFTAASPMDISGPARGHAMMATRYSPTGTMTRGTLNNCANGYTPWGTYLTCEENFNGYFGSTAAAITAAPLTLHERRYGVSRTGFGYRWHEADPRFDIRQNPNEPNRFGWVVEIDPHNPDSTPVKRTALGRFKHEGAWVVTGADNTVVVYMGDDERNEYVYKFVCANKYNPANRAANRSLLDSGTLYVARFNADGSGAWLPLVWGQNGLTPENGFADQGEVAVKCRQAADRMGATMMDRPEWSAVHPATREVYLTLTNNSRRGNTPASSNKTDGTSTAASANPPVDAANPRPDNDYGHIIRWREAAGNVAATTFEWDIFAQCGDKATTKTLGASYTPGEFGGQSVGYAGNVNGNDYGAPDGLWFDKDGRLWIQTDQQGDAKGDWANIGGNAMLCADPVSGETRRFLTSPPNCEVTGVVTTPDGKTMFVGIQHPGEDWTVNFTDNSSWPDSGANGPTTFSGLPAAVKPRSGVMVITKNDGGVIGTGSIGLD